MEQEAKHDDISVWIGVLQDCDKGGNEDLRIEMSECEISIPCDRNIHENLLTHLNKFQSAFTEPGMALKVKAWRDKATQKRKLIQNLASLNLCWLEPMCEKCSLDKICKMLRKMALKDKRNNRN